MPQVAIAMGSDSDLETMKEAAKVLQEFGIENEIVVTSAHRSPKRTHQWALELEKRGVEVVIAGAGMAAHLAGVLASLLTLPVIGVPLEGSPLQGLDSLLSTVQMPPGIPVATVAIGKAGAKNAGFLALQILAVKDKELKKKLIAHRERLEKEIEEKNRKLKG
jgi:phosphoribosylaminoimidazole carboxylase PurE protein